ncbi:hypothetical protein HU200_003687 [Digitaria exilis]|uniref:Uncharacterized protein n=1 Tax=Digitaria exilis TaxID=1010633 RepID=A0A835FTQ0_9POAL|nr:hypothetical protein HU200_003687 [Digitaria exilis]
MNSEAADHSSPPRSSGCYLQVTEEKPDLRMPRDPRAVRSFLLGRIRGYYIDVISRLPAGELRTSIARGLLVGGHCYGPLHSVHNIIFNSVWYAAAFPFRGDDPIDVDAARHPKPAALAHFATSVLPAVERDALSVLAGKRRLSSQDIVRLSAMLQPLPLPDDEVQRPQPYPRKLRVRIDRIIAERRSWTSWYQTMLDVADAALRKFARQTGARYRLHTIYGQNIVRTGEFRLGRCIHINFMAWPKGKPNRSQSPVHFFAEALNPPTRNCSEENITLCCMLGPVVQTVALGKEPRLRGIKVFSEQWYGPFRNGEQLDGCALRETAFAASEKLDVSEVLGQWETTDVVAARFSDELDPETVSDPLRRRRCGPVSAS